MQTEFNFVQLEKPYTPKIRLWKHMDKIPEYDVIGMYNEMAEDMKNFHGIDIKAYKQEYLGEFIK